MVPTLWVPEMPEMLRPQMRRFSNVSQPLAQGFPSSLVVHEQNSRPLVLDVHLCLVFGPCASTQQKIDSPWLNTENPSIGRRLGNGDCLSSYDKTQGKTQGCDWRNCLPSMFKSIVFFLVRSYISRSATPETLNRLIGISAGLD